MTDQAHSKYPNDQRGIPQDPRPGAAGRPFNPPASLSLPYISPGAPVPAANPPSYEALVRQGKVPAKPMTPRPDIPTQDAYKMGKTHYERGKNLGYSKADRVAFYHHLERMRAKGFEKPGSGRANLLKHAPGALNPRPIPGRMPTIRSFGGGMLGMLNFGPIDAAKQIQMGQHPQVEPERIPDRVEYLQDPWSLPFPDQGGSAPGGYYQLYKDNPKAGEVYYES